MERKRLFGLVSLGIGLLSGLVGKVTSLWELELVATIGLLTGGVMIATSYRAERAHLLSGSRASLVVSSATSRAMRRSRAPGATATGPGSVQAYATGLTAVLGECELLLTNADAGTAALDAARERLVVLVASPNYGRAIERGLITEESVRSVSLRLAART